LLRHLKSHEESLLRKETVVRENDGVNSGYNPSSALPNPVSPNSDSLEFQEGEEGVENYSADFGVRILTELLSNFCSSLLANGVNNSTVDFIVKELQYCFSESFNLILKIAKQFDDNFEGFSEQLKLLLSVFQKVKSSYQRQQLFEKNEQFVLPVEKSLGTRTEVRVKDSKRQQVVVSDTFMYVPILKTLEKIVSCPQFINYFRQGDSTESTSGYEHFKDSLSFKSNKLFSALPNSIQVQLFYDDFETANPLGSKRGVHKIGALYFILRNHPDFLNSQLSQIHLLGLFYAEDAKKYGINSIIRHILPDIEILETKGIRVHGVEILGTLCAVSHDNLGGNTLLGFMESFSSTYYCRICCTSKSDAQDIFDHNEMIIRNRDNYSHHLSSQSFGV